MFRISNFYVYLLLLATLWSPMNYSQNVEPHSEGKVKIMIHKNTGDEVINLDTTLNIDLENEIDIESMLQKLGLEGLDDELRNLDINMELFEDFSQDEESQSEEGQRIRKKIYIQGPNAKELEWVDGCEANDKPFLGIMSEQDSDASNITITDIVPSSAAEIAGLQIGDIIMAIDGEPTPTLEVLKNIISTKQVNDQINISFLREGVSNSTIARLKPREGSNLALQQFFNQSMPLNLDSNGGQQPFIKDDHGYLGVILGDQTAVSGAYIQEVNPESAAAKAGILPGDYITKLDDVTILKNEDLLAAVKEKKIGEQVIVIVQRGQKKMEISATLQKRQIRNFGLMDPENIPGFDHPHHPMQMHKFYDFKGSKCRPQTGERDACCKPSNDDQKCCEPNAPVYMGIKVREYNYNDDGLLIDEVISESPASQSDLNPGYRILSVDGQRINTYEELIELLQTKKAGDQIIVKYRADNGKKHSTSITLADKSANTKCRPNMNNCHGSIESDDLYPPHKNNLIEKSESKTIESSDAMRERGNTAPSSNLPKEEKEIHIKIQERLEDGQPNNENVSGDSQPKIVSVSISITNPSKDELNKVGISKLKDQLDMDDLQYFPNPSNGEFSIQMDHTEHGAGELNVYTLSGQKIYSENIEDLYGLNKKTIKLDTHNPGVYVLQIKQGNKSLEQKIVIE